ncbi:GtrA family protein [Leifsonia sp. McL0607]|uniref:GtrA family protein n=1 Tax=Leifsonia sp. McL0607 TaxID=3415672 RepID=UPI003CEEFB1D
MRILDFSERAFPLFRQLLRFLSTTVVGVAIDVGGFVLLAMIGLPAGIANMTSAGVSVLAVYALSRGMVFPGRHTAGGLLAFFGWYAVSILLFSWLIQWGVDVLAIPELLAKLISLPLSFTLNFIAVRSIFAVVDRGVTRG